MKAIVMAGGFGTRLRPLTIKTPKPMAPVANIPVMQDVVDKLKSAGISDITAMLFFQPEVIKAHFKNLINYLEPKTDLGTAGCVKFAFNELNTDDTFLVISADLLTDIDLNAAIEFHKKKSSTLTILLTSVKNPLQYGIIILEKDTNRIIKFLEKPSWGEIFSDKINTGIYIIEPSIMKYIPDNTFFDFSKNLFPKLMELDIPIYGYETDGYWKDIGDISDYKIANMDALAGKVKYNIPQEKITYEKDDIKGIAYIQKNTNIENTIIEGICIVGSNTVVKNSRIVNSIIGNNNTIEDSTIVKSILWDNVKINKNSTVLDAILTKNVRVGTSCMIDVGAVIGEDVEVGSGARVGHEVRIWPDKVIEYGAEVSHSIVWGKRFSRSLFGDGGIKGVANFEITPEFAARLGAAIGSYLGKKSYVITSRCPHKASRMIKRSLISGLLSTGVRVGDLRTSPLPVMRYEIGKEGEVGGIHVRVYPFDQKQIEIKIFGARGELIPTSVERTIEQYFIREDFPRANINETGEIVLPPRAQEHYIDGFLKSIKLDEIRRKNMKVVIDYNHSPASMVLPTILGECHIEVIALNADINPQKSTYPKDIKNELEQLSDVCVSLKADCGFLLDPGGERVYVVDERGRIIQPQELMLIIIHMLIKTGKKGSVVVPVAATSLLEDIKDINIIRTQMSQSKFEETVRNAKPVFASTIDAGYIFPEFNYSLDGLYTICKIVELLCILDTRISRIEREIPVLPFTEKVSVPCSFEKKASVMRMAIAEAMTKKSDFTDGVKIFNKNSWILILPDPETPFINLYVEAENMTELKDLISNYKDRITKWKESS